MATKPSRRAPTAARARAAVARRDPAAADRDGGSAASPTEEPLDLGRALGEAFLVNERVNQVLLDLLDPAVWRAAPACSRRRNIATTFAHMHNVRCMRLKMSGDRSAVPERLDRGEVTMEDAREALTTSAGAMVGLIEDALARGGRVRGFRPGIVLLVVGAVVHEAHHRGQVCHWARELGSPLSPEQQLLLWEWDQRWKDVVGG